MSQQEFPPFSLSRLLRCVFAPKNGERICILLDFKDPERSMTSFAFLKEPGNEIQKLAYEHFYQGLADGVAKELGLSGGEIFAYRETGGSNLDLPQDAFDPTGKRINLESEVYPKYDIILCISTFSATAPLTAFCKQYGFRGATLHGLNPIILSSGLSVDYDAVSATAEKMRAGMTKADKVEIDFVVGGEQQTLTLELGQQEAQKSHGLCRGGADVANLPAGEIYFVPTGAVGQFPLVFEDGTLGWMEVEDCHIVGGRFLKGDRKTFDAYIAKVTNDPAAGEIGELGFGTQELPVSGRDIQDEKVLGTLHVATGRSDHLGGEITPDKFKHAGNATHEDILFAPHKTPDVAVPQVRWFRDGRQEILIENYQASEFIRQLRAG
ncbi:MAG: hypothetical protein KDD69_19330 [Bdellovibrionales bacterium]|nr:hypothetical protein [Bdellovibrionales bacterium]